MDMPCTRNVAADLFLSHEICIDRAIKAVIRRRRVGADDAEDFASTVKVRLLENDQAVLRKYQARSSVATFLVKVVDRMLLDYRIAHWGKWRPSAEARRLGTIAMDLERLMSRDGLTFTEAAEALSASAPERATTTELWRLYCRLPARVPRRMVSTTDADMPAECVIDPDLPLSKRHACETLRALRRALARLTPDDADLLERRFTRGLQIAQIAADRRIEPRLLYRRVAALLRRLRSDMEARGIFGADVDAWLGRLEVRGPALSDRLFDTRHPLAPGARCAVASPDLHAHRLSCDSV